MNAGISALPRMERWMAGLLYYGSWLASIAIGLGLVIDTRIATAGVVLFIILPSLRVLLMLGIFVRKRDFRLAAAAALVLTIILLGILAGTRTSSAGAG